MAKSEKKLLNKAWQETKQLQDGEIFLLKDLFKGYKWNRLPTQTRMGLGRAFMEKASGKKSVEVMEKSSSQQQQYKKIG